MGMTRWTVNGRAAEARDVAEQLALGRQTVKKRSAIERENRALDHDAKTVGRALRKGAREAGRGRFPIRCAPAPVAGRRKGTLRSRRFEALVGLRVSRPSKVGSDGLSSFHCKFTSRGLGNGGGRSYMRGEAVKAVRYIMRDAAREIEGGGIVSNISADPDVIAGVFAAIEELEHLGRDNANMYMSLVIALPHELQDRETLLAGICAPFEQLGVPFAGVLHRPDKDGDQRNYHTHVMFSMRPFKRLDDGSFAFANETLSWMNTGDYITEFHARTAEVFNAAMAREGHKRRFTPLSNAARGEAPRSKGEGKSTPGRKHHERRAEDLALMKQEQQVIAERAADSQELAAALRNIVVRPSVEERVAAIIEQEAVIARSLAPRPRPEPARADPAAVSALPAPGQSQHPLAEGHPRPAVAHAQPAVPVEAAPSRMTATPKSPAPDPASPPQQPHAQPVAVIAKPELDQPSHKADDAPNRDRASGLPASPTRRSNGALLKTAREAARRRTRAPIDNGIPAGRSPGANADIGKDDSWVRERVIGRSQEEVAAPKTASPKTPKPAAPSPAPLTVEARIDDIVKRFKKRPEYQALPAFDRSHLDEYIDRPCRFVGEGLIGLRFEDGRLQMNIREIDIPFVDRLVNDVPGGLALLHKIASELGTDMPVGPTLSWQAVVGNDDDLGVRGLDRGGEPER